MSLPAYDLFGYCATEDKVEALSDSVLESLVFGRPPRFLVKVGADSFFA